MFVLTVDQRGSRRRGDRVADLLEALGPRPGLLRPVERTVGDEVQTVTDQPAVAVDLALDLLRRGEWSVGIGAGGVEVLPRSVRAASGAAFVHAREAVERAKSRARPVPLAVVADDPVRAADAEALLWLLAALRARRTQAGWDVTDAVAAGATQDTVAARLGISQQAVSQRLRAAHAAEEAAALPTAARLLARADAAGQDGAPSASRADRD